jgi:mannose-1-phosphate guanylyltransferase
VQALVLAGGQGTRLRPLTYTTPKPVMPLAGRPFLTFMLDWLRGHGVGEAILSCGFMSDGVREVLGDVYGGMRLRYAVEQEPLGTAGPVRLALDQGILEERLLVLNGDVLTDMDLTAEVEQHERTGARCTLALIEVDDTASYGVVPTADDGRVEAFLEKTDGEVPTNRINAGAYVLEREVVEALVPAGRAVSFEREVFPRLVGDGLYGWAASGYWIDIGTPERYLEATYDLLSGAVESTLPPRDETGSLIGDGCLTSGAHIGPQTVLGAHCSVGSDSSVERSVLHDRVLVGADCRVRDAVLAEGVRVGDGARIEPGAMVGARARIEAGAVVASDARIDPDATVGGPSGDDPEHGGDAPGVGLSGREGAP